MYMVTACSDDTNTLKAGKVYGVESAGKLGMQTYVLHHAHATTGGWLSTALL